MIFRCFALIYGIAFLLVGIAGFIPALVSQPTPDGVADGRLFGLFPVNTLHNVVHIAFGLWGLATVTSVSAMRLYARVVAVVYAVLAVMGLIPGLNTTFGLVPLYGHDVWLHAVLAAVAAYVGWAVSEHRATAAQPR